MKQQQWRALLVGAMAMVLGQSVVLAAGFESQSLSTSSMGTANASASVYGYDASNQFHNPATLSDIKKATITFGGQLVLPDLSYSDQGSTYADGSPLEGQGGPDTSNVLVIPSLYYAIPVGEDLAYGMSINTPYASKTEYDPLWVGRFHSKRSRVTAYNINPALSYRYDEVIAFGVGLSMQYADTSLKTAVNEYAACIIGFENQGAPPATAEAACAPVLDDEGSQKLSGDSWGLGWNAGATLQLLETFRLALDYRSAVYHNMNGQADFEDINVANPAIANGGLIDAPADLDLDLPQSFSVAMLANLTPSLDWMVDFSWMDWSSIDTLVIKYQSNQPDTVLPQKWEEAYRLSTGFEYQASSTRYRIGFAFDESPVTQSAYRSPRVPDSDRYWFSLGLNQQISETVDVDLGYTFIHADSAKTETESPTGEVLNGKFDNSAHLLGAHFNWRF